MLIIIFVVYSKKPMLIVECGASHGRLLVDSFIKQCNRATKNTKKKTTACLYCYCYWYCYSCCWGGNAKFAIGFLPQQMVKFTCLSAVGVLDLFLPMSWTAARCDQQQCCKWQVWQVGRVLQAPWSLFLVNVGKCKKSVNCACRYKSSKPVRLASISLASQFSQLYRLIYLS